MLTIQQLFQKVDTNEFIKKFIEYNSNDYSSKIFNFNNSLDFNAPLFEKQIDNIKSTLETFRTCEIVEDKDNIVFVTPLSEDDFLVYESYFIQKEDILKGDKDCDKYAYELNDYKETLGYSVSETTLYYLGEIATAVGIFSEMTFCGIDVEERDDYVDEIRVSLEEAMEEVKEMDPDCLRPIDEIFQEIGYIDERKSYEKDFDEEKYRMLGKIRKLKYDFFIEQEKIFMENSAKELS